jgi:hypothetical protein
MEGAVSLVALVGAMLVEISVGGQLRLSAQRVEGARRICTYTRGGVSTYNQGSTGIYSQGGETRYTRSSTSRRYERRIGSGEPCPAVYREPEPEVEIVPSMAILAMESRENGQAVCLYRYAGREYRALRGASLRCPMTPNGSMAALTGRAGN